jgi:hypothetical protein
MTRFFEALSAPPEPMLVVAGAAIVIAALAGLLGVSGAIVPMAAATCLGAPIALYRAIESWVKPSDG